MQAVILAAGMGMRLGSFTKARPKALVRVAGRELILRVLDFLDHPAISERVVVAGFESEKLSAFLAKHDPKVKMVHNPNFRDGSIRSIETALELVKGDFLIVNADHIYPKRMLNKIIEDKRGVTAVCDFDRTLGSDDMKVKLGAGGTLKFIGKKLSDFDCGYIGMTFCAMFPAYRAAVVRTRNEEGNTAAVESALGSMASNGGDVHICDTSGLKWLEVDTPEDLAVADRVLQENPNFLS